MNRRRNCWLAFCLLLGALKPAEADKTRAKAHPSTTSQAEPPEKKPPLPAPDSQTPTEQPPVPDQAPPSAAEAEAAPVVEPKLTILSSRPTPDGGLSLEVEAFTSDGSEPDFELRINGKVATPTAPPMKTRDVGRPNLFLLSVALPHSDCELSLVAHSHGAESVPARLPLHWTGRAAEKERRPAMFMLGVGIGKYLHEADIPGLAFPSKDARDLAATLSAQRSSVYRAMPPKLLLDKEATHEQIREGLRWLQQVVQPKDTAVVFLAGHGTNLEGLYYYLPYETDIRDSHTMLSGTELQAELKRIPGRVLLLLDTCHSGGVLGQKSSLDRLNAEMTSEPKIVVFAASTGSETSRESPAWGNGAFTKALVEGLRGRADYEEDNKLYLSELETWVGTRVRSLTLGGQTPTVAKPSNFSDYIVAALPKDKVLPTPRQSQRKKLLAGLLAGGAAAAILIGVLAARPWTLTGPPTTDLVFH